jgi:hypothetical protein
MVLLLIFLSGCGDYSYSDLPFQNSSTTLQLKVQNADSDLLNRHKIYISDGSKYLGSIDAKSGIQKIDSSKLIHLTIEYLHRYHKVVKSKSIILYPEKNTNYFIWIESADMQNKIYFKELKNGKLYEVGMNRLQFL